VYAIERSFRIADSEGGVSTIDTVEGEPTKSPTRHPTSGPGLFDGSNNLDTTPADSDDLFKTEEPFVTLDAGFHTIDPAYVVNNLGYSDATIPVEVFVTSNSFAMVTDGVIIAPTKGNSISLSVEAYVLANGGVFIGSSSGDELPPGDGIHLQGQTKVDIMEGTLSEGGSTIDPNQQAGASVHTSGEAKVIIKGGEFIGGTNSANSDNNGPSLEVMGNSTVEIYGGTFFGAWRVQNKSSVLLHACQFTFESGVVKAKLLDTTMLEVQVTSDSTRNIMAEIYSAEICLTRGPTKQPTQLPTLQTALPMSPLSLRPTASPSQSSLLAPSPMPTLEPSSKLSALPSRLPSTAAVSKQSPVPSSSPTNDTMLESFQSQEGSSNPSVSPTPKPLWETFEFAPSVELDSSSGQITALNFSTDLLHPQNTSIANPTNIFISEYSDVVGPVTTSNIRMALSLSDQAIANGADFFVETASFAKTTSNYINQFYSDMGKEAYGVKADIKVHNVAQVGATLWIEVVYQQTTLFRSYLTSYDITVEDVIRGPFLTQQGKGHFNFLDEV
jgi:hypothetical protein